MSRPSRGAGWCSKDLSALRPSEVTWVIVDLETTGLDPCRDAIREVAAFVVRPGGQIESAAAWQADGDPADALVAGLARLAQLTSAGGVLVAHNLAFDLSFLAMCPDAPKLLVRPPAWLCTMRMVSEIETLDVFARRFGVEISGRHTAEGDAFALARVLAVLAKRYGLRDIGEIAVELRAGRGSRSKRSTAQSESGGWSAVRAGLDHVVPIAPVSRQQRDTFDATVRLLAHPSSGPENLVDHDACVTILRCAQITAAALDLLVAELS